MGKSSRQPLMVGNWKMNINHFEAIALVQKIAFGLNDADLDAVDVVVLPPFTDLRTVHTLVEADKLRVRYGAQDLSPFARGAYTGDISGAMLAKLGCRFVTVGHSERREHHHETNEVVAAKAVAAWQVDIAPIVCVGEGLEIREAHTHLSYCVEQLRESLAGLTAEQIAKSVIAYEPVWAIGTGKVASPEDAQQMCAALRGLVQEMTDAATADAIRILYGGSVKMTNIAGIMASPDVDGALVGGASLDAEEFVGIVRYRLHPDADALG
ncbi:MAG: triose-phosphate isomerase [Candidatus Nanopelagicales bacterium]